MPLYLRLQSVRGTLNRDQIQDNGNLGTIRIGTWNTQWAKPHTRRGKLISDRLAATDCDVLYVTKGFAGTLVDRGHVIEAGPDWGYRIVPGQPCVPLWSKRPWTPHPMPSVRRSFRKAGSSRAAKKRARGLPDCHGCVDPLARCARDEPTQGPPSLGGSPSVADGVDEAALPVPRVANRRPGRLQPEHSAEVGAA